MKCECPVGVYPFPAGRERNLIKCQKGILASSPFRCREKIFGRVKVFCLLNRIVIEGASKE